MIERRCDFKTVFEASDGKAICPDKFNVQFREKGNCDTCPKPRGINRAAGASSIEGTTLGDVNRAIRVNRTG